MQSLALAHRIGLLALTGLVLVGLTMTASARRVAGTEGAEGAAAAAALGLVDGTPAMASAGALAFGPGSVLFIGDTVSAAVHAIDVQDAATDTSAEKFEVDQIDKKIAALLGATADDILIRDMKVHRPSQHVYLSVQRGRGAGATPVLLRVARDGKIDRVAIENVKYATAPLTNAPAVGTKTKWGEEMRTMSITGLSFVGNEVFVAGLSKEEFASDLRRIAFPFAKGAAHTSIEIFHTSHNRYETHAPIVSFVPITLKGVPSLLAGYGCAPIATFAIDALKDGAHVRGSTLAELGGGNAPTDMITFNKDGKPVIIVANSNRTLMRIKTEDLERQTPLTKGVDEAFVSAGAPYVSISTIGVLQLDDLNSAYAVILQRDIQKGTLDLRSLPKKWL